MDFLAKSLGSKRQEQWTALKPQLANISNGKAIVFPDSPQDPGTATSRDEIAETPEPESKSHRSASLQGTELATLDNELPYHSIDDNPVFDPPSGADMSVSPRGSEQINRVNHYPGRFIDPPSTARPKPSTPRRSIFGRQSNASRVVVSAGSEESRTAENRHQPAERPIRQPLPTIQGRPRKRGRGDSEDEASDEHFSLYNRSHDDDQHRAQIPERARPSEQWQRMDHDGSMMARQLHKDLAVSQQQTRVARPEDSSPAPARRESRWHAENSVSRASHQPATIRPTGHTSRRRWTHEEDDRLIMLVARYGTQWAVIQRQDQICPEINGGPQLTDRTQVNMKDRARNIKQKLIRYFY